MSRQRTTFNFPKERK
uniref:Uncharacterized protein n=1 Tax=Arundo donax TaxID=35708 RepID=A0A0A8Z9N2_ARUDO